MIHMRVETNRSIVSDERNAAGHSHEILVKTTVIAPDHVQNVERRLPLHIGIVIDRSGSMSGRKLENAISAAQRMVERLNTEDRCVVVAFDTDVSLLADGAPVSDTRRAMIRAALRAVRAGSTTNLAGGWDLAVRTLLQYHIPNQCISRVILLTDGVANVGLSDRDGLAAQAKIYADRGISTSTYGLGLDYSEATLTAMSQAGLGNHHFIEKSDDIDMFFGAELQELFAVAVTDASVTVALPEGYTGELLGGQPHTRDQQHLTIPIGAMVALEQRSLYFRLTPLSLTPHGVHQMKLEVHGNDSAQQQLHANANAQWELTDVARAEHAYIHTEIEQEAVLIDVARVRAEADRLNREGRLQEASAYVIEQQMRSEIFSKARHYQEAADVFSRPRTAVESKTEQDRTTMRRRASSKDLYILRMKLDEKIKAGAPAHEIAAAEADLEEFLRFTGWQIR